MNKNPIKTAIVVIIIILVFVGAYFLIDKYKNKDKDEYGQYLKNYEVNEYIATYISDEDMAKIYLNDYIHNMYYDIEKAYNSLDVEYREKKFKNIEGYKNYVYSLKYSTYDLANYYIRSEDGYIIFGINDKNGNFYAFKTKGVMQYTVYLDDYTVEIW